MSGAVGGPPGALVFGGLGIAPTAAWERRVVRRFFKGIDRRLDGLDPGPDPLILLISDADLPWQHFLLRRPSRPFARPATARRVVGASPISNAYPLGASMGVYGIGGQSLARWASCPNDHSRQRFGSLWTHAR